MCVLVGWLVLYGISTHVGYLTVFMWIINLLRACTRWGPRRHHDGNKKKDARFKSSNINCKRTQGMGTSFQDADECERKQPINTLAK